VGLGGRGDDRYRSYSLGMKQRLGIAAALAGEPELLILDEPSNGLDPEGVREMRALVGSLRGRGRTVLVSSHDLSELEQVCDWLLLIEAGRTLYQGPTAALLAGVHGLAVAPEHPGDRAALAAVLAARGLDARLDGDDRSVLVHTDGGTGAGTADGDVAALAATVNRAAFEAGVVLIELRPLRSSLEDRYLALVRGGAR
jgi:ABC-2 type transport system ATP-binding protein